MVHTDLARSLVISLLFVSASNFLCCRTVREKLRWPIWLIVGITLVEAVLHYWFRSVTWLGTQLFLATAFLLYRRATDAPSFSLLFILLIDVTFLMLMNTVCYYFAGSSYIWGWADVLMLGLLLAAALPFMSYLLREKVWPKLEGIETKEMAWMAAIPIVFIVVITLLCSSHIQYIVSDRVSMPYALIAALLAVAIAATAYLILKMLEKTQESASYQADVRMMDLQLSTQAKRFSEFLHYMDEIRVLRHDMLHHFRVVKGLLEEGQYETASMYLRQHDLEITQQEAFNYSQNYIGDVMARHAQRRAAAAGIEATTQCALPADCWISDADLCVLLGNMSENAFNACMRQESGRKFIHAYATFRGDEAILTVENSYDPLEDAISVDEMARLGQGLPSIRAIAKKYGGIATFERMHGAFYSTVVLYRPRGGQSSCQARANAASPAS